MNSQLARFHTDDDDDDDNDDIDDGDDNVDEGDNDNTDDDNEDDNGQKEKILIIEKMLPLLYDLTLTIPIFAKMIISRQV